MGKISGKHPIEQKARAFALFMDYVPDKEISRILEIPLATIHDWRYKSTIEMDGVEIIWKDFRDLVEPRRALASSERELKRTVGFEWDEYVGGHRDNVAEQCEIARNYIEDCIRENRLDDKGNPVVKPSIAALKQLTETELLLQGKATKFVKVQHDITVLVGKITRHVLDRNITDKQLKEVILDQLEDGYARVVASGGDEKALQKVLK